MSTTFHRAVSVFHSLIYCIEIDVFHTKKCVQFALTLSNFELVKYVIKDRWFS